MQPHARYEDERWEATELAGVEAEGVELRDMELVKVELTGARLRAWSLRDTRLRECSLANVEAPYSEWNAVELHGCRLDGIRSVENLRGAAMPWEDIVGNAGLFAAAAGIRATEA